MNFVPHPVTANRDGRGIADSGEATYDLQDLGREVEIMKRNLVWIGILAGAMLLAACGGEQTGTLNGTVTLKPVVSAGEIAPTPSPADFAARQILILQGNGISEVMRADIDPNGHYSVILLPGVYVIDITHDGPAGTSGLPKQIQIIKGETTTLDVTVQISGG